MKETERIVMAAKGLYDIQQEMDRILHDLAMSVNHDEQHRLQQVYTKLCLIESKYKAMERRARHNLELIRKCRQEESNMNDMIGYMSQLKVTK